jgi:AraC-like DNA-binding protein
MVVELAAVGASSRRKVFSSDQLPSVLDERRRRSLWRDVYSELYGPLEVRYAEGRPFSARLEFTGIGGLGLVGCTSTVERFVRTRRCVALAASDSFHLVINVGGAPMAARQIGRAASLEPGAMTLLTDAEPGEFIGGAENRWMFVTAPRQRLLDLAGTAEHQLARPIDGSRPAARHLRRYLEFVASPHPDEGAAELEQVVEATLLDLIALVVGANQADPDGAGQRGLRAARLQEIVSAIGTSYDDPAFSVHRLASQVGLSPRYVQDLLHDTGVSLTERVLERRLQKARKMLMSAQCRDRRVIDIALACGFGAVSYFNRVFRRRFGVSPSELRRTPMAADLARRP